ncbi:MAG: hypothetical protein ACOCRO_03150 [Halanaerobiales bacterium]
MQEVKEYNVMLGHDLPKDEKTYSWIKYGLLKGRSLKIVKILDYEDPDKYSMQRVYFKLGFSQRWSRLDDFYTFSNSKERLKEIRKSLKFHRNNHFTGRRY